MKRKRFKVVVFFCVFFLLGQVDYLNFVTPPAVGENTYPTYGYYYKGSLIILNASEKFVVIEETGTSFNAFVQKMGLKRDPLSDRESLRKRNLGLYRLAIPESKDAERIDSSVRMRSWARTTNELIQPVFEQGQALLIPSDEIIVGFKATTSLDQAQEYFERCVSGQGIVEVNEHRRNTYILKINSPSNGRSFQVSRFLSKLDEIDFAEPNFLVVMLNDQTQMNKFKTHSHINETVSVTGEPTPTGLTLSSEMSPLVPTWTTIISLDFESSTFPPSGWILGWYAGAISAYWGRTSHRAHNGSHSIYCALGGSAGVSPPGPAPTDMAAILRSPYDIDLSLYEEVYVEVWFYAKNDLYENTHYDWAAAKVCNKTGWTCAPLEDTALACGYTGDCTTDPTTENGWRKFLYRVPPNYRVPTAYFEFYYNSNDERQYEGVYLDDIRIVGTTDVDTEVISSDTYSARQYELKNVGQIAGLGNDANDMEVPEAWDLVSLSSKVVVAVIDSGVDLTHPDLNLVTGYDYDGTQGGGPRDENAHGTGCAGNAGAIANNGMGVVGTAPGVKIMSVYRGTTVADAALAIDVAASNGADILSNSWGGVMSPVQDIENAINDALAEGKVVLFGAGNGPDREPYTYDVMFPCNLTESTDLICVGASSPTDEHKAAASSDGQHWWGSSYVGSGPDVCAPGPWSYTTDIQGVAGYNDGSSGIDADYTHEFGGTSSSTPKVAGIVALMLSANPYLTPAQVKSILRNTADDIDTLGADDKTGAGRVNAYSAVIGSRQAPPGPRAMPWIPLLLMED